MSKNAKIIEIITIFDTPNITNMNNKTNILPVWYGVGVRKYPNARNGVEHLSRAGFLYPNITIMTKLKESLTDEQTTLIEKLTKEISVNPITQTPEYNIRITGDYIGRLRLVADIVEVSRMALLNDTYEPVQIAPSVANVLQMVNELIPYDGAELLNRLKGI